MQCGRGGIGRRARLRIWYLRCAGSTPVARTKRAKAALLRLLLLYRDLSAFFIVFLYLFSANNYSKNTLIFRRMQHDLQAFLKFLRIKNRGTKKPPLLLSLQIITCHGLRQAVLAALASGCRNHRLMLTLA